MSLFRTLEPLSRCPRTHSIASQSLFALLCPAVDALPKSAKRHIPCRVEASLPSAEVMDNLFITALVRAGSCQAHTTTKCQRSSEVSSTSFYHKDRRKAYIRPSWSRGIHTRRDLHHTNSHSSGVSEKELHDLVDIYEEWDTSMDKEENKEKRIDSSVGPEAVHPWQPTYFTDNSHTRDISAKPNTSQEEQPVPNPTVDDIVAVIAQSLDDPNGSLQDIFQLYRQLPDAGIRFLPDNIRRKFLDTFQRANSSRIDRRQRDWWLQIIEDMRSEKIEVGVGHWTTAIHFTALIDGMKEAFAMWKDMEENHGILANEYTFNILFNVAVKSENYALAGLVEKEARERNIVLDRVSRMARIYYNGLLGDGAGVRQAYGEFVQSGEIVDTAVLTNVITSLIKSGEITAAEETFERMKRLHEEKIGATMAPGTWKHRKELRVVLTQAAHKYRHKPDDRKAFQDAAPINPDWKTYRAFMEYHVLKMGDFQRLQDLLEEMEARDIRLTDELYSLMFRGFVRYGGVTLTPWNLRNLERLWSQYKRSCEQDRMNTSLNDKTVLQLVKAFAKCGNNEHAQRIWNMVLERWTPAPETTEAVGQILTKRKTWNSR